MLFNSLLFTFFLIEAARKGRDLALPIKEEESSSDFHEFTQNTLEGWF